MIVMSDEVMVTCQATHLLVVGGDCEEELNGPKRLFLGILIPQTHVHNMQPGGREGGRREEGKDSVKGSSKVGDVLREQ